MGQRKSVQKAAVTEVEPKKEASGVLEPTKKKRIAPTKVSPPTRKPAQKIPRAHAKQMLEEKKKRVKKPLTLAQKMSKQIRFYQEKQGPLMRPWEFKHWTKEVLQSHFPGFGIENQAVRLLHWAVEDYTDVLTSNMNDLAANLSAKQTITMDHLHYAMAQGWRRYRPAKQGIFLEDV